MTDFADRRYLMVENQLRPSAIEDPAVLAAMGAVPRERFVPDALKGVAYGDEDIDLGGGRHLIEPLVLGKMLQHAGSTPDDRALVVGCATGYCAAVLAEMVKSVTFVTQDRLAETNRLFDTLGYANIVSVAGAARDGDALHAPFDLILIGGAVYEIPDKLLGQLADGGRLVTVHSEKRRMGKVTVVTKVGNGFGSVTPYDAACPLVPELIPAPSFTF